MHKYFIKQGWIVAEVEVEDRRKCKMNDKTFEIVSGLAMLVASLILTYIFDKLLRFFHRRRLAASVTPSVATLEATATSLANTTAQLEATVTLFNNRVTAEQPREEPATARQVEEASTLIPSDSATSSTATSSHSLQNHMPSREYADNVVLLNPQSHFPLTIHSAVTGTTSAATPEAIATPAADTSATILEATATVRNEAVTQEQLREDPAIARQVEEASTLVPSHAATSSNAARVVESSNHSQRS